MERERSYNQFSEVLKSLRNPKGGHIVWRQDDLDGLWRIGASLDDLLKLFKLQDDQDNEKFFASTVILLTERKNYTVSDYLRLAALRDTEDEEMLISSNELFDLLEVEGKKVEEIEKIATLVDSDGKTIFRHDKDFGGDFEGVDSIVGALKRGLTFDQINEITALLDKNGKSIFRTPRDIKRFLEAGGTADYAKKLASIFDHRGEQIFNEFSIGLLKEYGASTDYAEEVASLKDTQGQTIFSDGEDIMRYFSDNKSGKGDLRLAENLVALKDSKNRTIFRDGGDILTISNVKNGLEKAKKFLEIKTSDGQNYFRGDEIAILLKYKVPFEYASKMAKQKVNALTIMYYFRLGFKEHQTEFENSDRPKLLILYPSSDPAGLFDDYVFRDDDSIAFIKKFESAYSLKLRVVSSVDEMFEEIEKEPEIELLWIGGHGTGTSIGFGEDKPKYGIKIDKNKKSLSVEIKEVGKRMRNLIKLKTILLDSCLSGKGGIIGRNMVNFMAQELPGVLVIGSKEETNARRTELLKTRPLEIKFHATYSGRECTYFSKR